MEPVMDVEKVPKQRWKLVGLFSPFSAIDTDVDESDLLHLPPEDGRLHSMWQQELLPGIPRHMRPASKAVPEDEIHSW